MSIIIKGMKLPESGEKIIILTSSGYVEDVSGRVIQGVEAIELQPHGRLGDLDALHNIVKQRTKNWAGGWDNLLFALTGNDVLNAPTVLEAEGKDDEQ